MQPWSEAQTRHGAYFGVGEDPDAEVPGPHPGTGEITIVSVGHVGPKAHAHGREQR